MCANPKTIRDIMIAAEELNMIDSGEYVFFNIEIFGSLKKDLRPWYDEKDVEDNRNERAKKAYQALLTITTRKPEDEEYQKFSDEVSGGGEIIHPHN
jgi:atrial natriuretic peptide receptor A